jgi:hypothetical protein
MSERDDINSAYVASGLLVIVASVPLALAIVAWHAFAASVLWRWFAVPILGLPPIGTLQAVGLLLVLSSVKAAKYRPAKDGNKQLLTWVVQPAVLLLVGAAIKPWI